VGSTLVTRLVAPAVVSRGWPGGSSVALAVTTPVTATSTAAFSAQTASFTASIVKLDILAALLLQRQDAGRLLTSAEQVLARSMITESDNDAASVLWQRIGGASGLAKANRRLGLRETVRRRRERVGAHPDHRRGSGPAAERRHRLRRRARAGGCGRERRGPEGHPTGVRRPVDGAGRRRAGGGGSARPRTVPARL
jgi:hypothetical protein